MNEMFPISSETAQKVWDNFDRELIHKLKPLPEEERNDVRLEILSHLYESMANAPINASGDAQYHNEDVRLINAISNLGSPDEYLEPLIADILLYQKASKGNPVAIWNGLRNSAKKGLMHALATLVLGMGYFWVIMIFIMSLMHMVNPDVGIWFYPGGEVSLSFEAQPGATQWLTEWFSLVGIVGSALAYWGLSKLLSFFIAKIK